MIWGFHLNILDSVYEFTSVPSYNPTKLTVKGFQKTKKKKMRMGGRIVKVTLTTLFKIRPSLSCLSLPPRSTYYLSIDYIIYL